MVLQLCQSRCRHCDDLALALENLAAGRRGHPMRQTECYSRDGYLPVIICSLSRRRELGPPGLIPHGAAAKHTLYWSLNPYALLLNISRSLRPPPPPDGSCSGDGQLGPRFSPYLQVGRRNN